MAWHYDDDGYKRNRDGSFWNSDEADSAVENGDLRKLGNGCYWDPATGDEFWPDGEKK